MQGLPPTSGLIQGRVLWPEPSTRLQALPAQVGRVQVRCVGPFWHGWSLVGQNRAMTTPELPSQPATQPRNPLHGMTLEAILTALVAHYGWAGLGERIPVRCFTHDPSITSSLKFLRKTPWARDKVEGLYLFMLREVRRNG